MADKNIRKEFVEGVQEIFTTLFNQSNAEEGDGVFFYPKSDNTTLNIYGESKDRVCKEPKLLVCKAVISPSISEQDVRGVNLQGTFTVTLKSLQNNGIDVSDLDSLCRGVMKFHNTFYLIDSVTPRAYVEDVFLLYDFSCTEAKNFSVRLESGV